jgi:hypothetical protein
VLALALTFTVTGLIAGYAPGEPEHVELARQAEALLEQAERARDSYQAHALAANALTLAQGAVSAAPGEYAALVDRADRALRDIDRVYTVEPSVLVHLGAASRDVSDIVMGGGNVYLLHLAEGSVRRFDSRTTNQRLEAGTVVAQRGAVVGARRLDTPVAMTWVSGEQGEAGALTIVDQARGVVQVSPGGRPVRKRLAGAAEWKRLNALASAGSTLYLLDGDAGQLLAYPNATEGVSECSAKTCPPLKSEGGSQVLDFRGIPTLPTSRAVEVLPLDDFYLRLDDGSVRRLDWQGHELPFSVRPPDASLGAVSAMASDGRGGLYLADPVQERILHVTAEGRLLRQLRSTSPSALSVVRSIKVGAGEQSLLSLGDSGILSIPLPVEIPTPIEGPYRDGSEGTWAADPPPTPVAR